MPDRNHHQNTRIRAGHDRYLPNTGEYESGPKATGPASILVLGGIKVPMKTSDGAEEGSADVLA
jgi:hypothetical protein